MESTGQKIRIELTDEQRQQVKAQFGKDFEALEFNAEELEQRIAPVSCANGKHFPGAVL